MLPLFMACRTRKSSSVRAMTSTIALPMPRTSYWTDIGALRFCGERQQAARTIASDLLRATLALMRLGVASDAPQSESQMAFKERVFSGVQPTGNLHLGNYLGAIVKFVALQERYDCIYCVIDLHAITVWQDPAELPRNTREVTAAFIACGIDPKKNVIFNQSQVAEHAELAWVFNCVARIGWLNRMTQFKEKAGKDRENASVGLYA